MSNHPTDTSPDRWRLFILDRRPADAKWLMATISAA
jgi:hypothetical protein